MTRMGRDMAIPLAVLIPCMVVVLVLYDTYDWSDGALGSIFIVMIAVTAAVGSMMAPIDRER